MLIRRIQRLYGREDFRANPVRAIVIRLHTKLASRLGVTKFATVLDGDISIEAPFSSSPGKAIRYIGVSEPETLATIRRMLVPGGTFVDVGAHLGEYALISVKQMGDRSRAYAFEPGSEIRPYLEKNVADSIFADQITVLDFGVSDFDGETAFTLGLDPGHSRIAQGAKAASTLKSSGEQRVKVVQLDTILFMNGVVPTTVKIDVEGSELQVFYGMRQMLDPSNELRPSIIFEYLERTWSIFGNSIVDLISYLKPTGYNIFGVEGGTLFPINSKVDADAATSHLNLDLVALLPEHITQAGFSVRISDER